MKLAPLGVLAVSVIAGSANAAVITRSYVTTANFTNAPVSAVSLSYTLTYDPAAVFPSGTITNYEASTSTAPFTGAVGVKFNFGGNVVIGKSPFGLDGVSEGDDDFVAAFSYGSSGNPIADTTLVYFTQSAGPGTFFASNAVTTVASVPEPATWDLMIVGFAVVGMMVRRRTSVALA